MASNAKRSKECIEDRISELPDEIVYRILSFFSTREAVKTSALSKRWKNVWVSVPNLDIDESEFRRGYSIAPKRFGEFVDRVLFFRGSSNIHKVRLKFSGAFKNASSFDAWICTVVRCNVVELDLSVGDYYSPYPRLYLNDYYTTPELILPKSLFTCSTLVSLKLQMDSKVGAIIPTSDDVCFSCLKFLHVTLHYPHSHSVQKLFSFCAQVLEGLIIDGTVGQRSLLNLYISAPKLKRLQISFDVRSCDENCKCRTVIHANVPNLEELDISYDFVVFYYFENAKIFLSKAKIDFKMPGIFSDYDTFLGHARRVRRFLAEIQDVKHLSISTYMLMVLGSNNSGFSQWPELNGFQCLPPTFINLNSLELQINTCYCWRSLINLLTISPNLEHLAIENDMYASSDCGVDSNHEWHPPDFVPICLALHLKTICLRRFQGTPNEMEVARYLVKHGQVLNKVKVSSFCAVKTVKLQSPVDSIMSEFSKLPRGSKICKVEFPTIV